MKKKAWIITLAGILLLGAIIFAFSVTVGRRPFQDLDPSEIVSATVRLIPPDTTIQITDIEELTDYLKDLVIYNVDNSYKKYAGQAVIFTLMLADGKQTEIMAYGSFLVVDHTGYRTEYEPSEALNAYANRLRQDENSILINEINHVPGGSAAEAVKAAVNLHAWVPVVVERADAHPVPVYFDSITLRSRPCGDGLFHGFKYVQ